MEPIENVMKRCTKQIYWYYPCLRSTISYVIDRCTEWFLIHVFLLKMAFDFSHCYSVLGIQIFASHTNPSYSLWSISFFCCCFHSYVLLIQVWKWCMKKLFHCLSKWIDAVWHLKIVLWELFHINHNKQNQAYYSKLFIIT